MLVQDLSLEYSSFSTVLDIKYLTFQGPTALTKFVTSRYVSKPKNHLIGLCYILSGRSSTLAGQYLGMLHRHRVSKVDEPSS